MIPNQSLLPSVDSEVLFTTAGMHPLVPNLLGEPHSHGQRLVNYQRCLRTSDIEEVGDSSHLTFFEMLGNWSLGDYSKEESLSWSWEFLTEILGMPKDRFSVSVFGGDQQIPRDQKSFEIWRKLGVPESRIHFYGREDNFWGPPGSEGPCGPDSEIFYWTGNDTPQGSPKTNSQWCEVWNNVFPSYQQTLGGELLPLERSLVDTGMGLERMVGIISNSNDVYQSELFSGLMHYLEEQSQNPDTRSQRIICDHLRSLCFLGIEGIQPSNIGQGYVMRRLLRRSVRHSKLLGLSEDWLEEGCNWLVDTYCGSYPQLRSQQSTIIETLQQEQLRFERGLKQGLKKLGKYLSQGHPLRGQEIFDLFQNHGLPCEVTVEECHRLGHPPSRNWQQGFEEHRQLHRLKSKK